ncbi:MAG: flavodoxin family protein [Spartobacteria bacterium]|nr:flavodoxin family protein [Spartobacteria bacterium]
MKVVAFNGSPRKGGNTEYMLRTLLDTIAAEGIETELVQVGGRKIHGCTACCRCKENQDKKCVIDVDMVNECIAKMLEADGIIMGSPSYFSGMTSEMKALIDRAGYVSSANGRMFARKIGAAVSVHRRGGAVNVMDQINHMFLISRMIVPGSTYWNFGVGREIGTVGADEEGRANMEDLGKTIAWLIKKLR